MPCTWLLLMMMLLLLLLLLPLMRLLHIYRVPTSLTNMLKCDFFSRPLHSKHIWVQIFRAFWIDVFPFTLLHPYRDRRSRTHNENIRTLLSLCENIFGICYFIMYSLSQWFSIQYRSTLWCMYVSKFHRITLQRIEMFNSEVSVAYVENITSNYDNINW